jgi:hypothetical protein
MILDNKIGNLEELSKSYGRKQLVILPKKGRNEKDNSAIHQTISIKKKERQKK